MLYSKSENFIFVHVWKTAGESLVEALRAHCDPPFNGRMIQKVLRKCPEGIANRLGWTAHLIHGQHLMARDIKAIMPDGLYNEAYSFGFVRNPWDWTVSAYEYARQTRANPEHKIVRRMNSLAEYVSFRESHLPRHQSTFLFDENDKQMVTKIGRFETLEDDVAEIGANIGKQLQLPRRNVTKRKRDWREYYDDETYDRVAKLYRKDLELLGYKA